MRLTTNRIAILKLMREHGPIDSRGVADALGWPLANAKRVLNRGVEVGLWSTLPLATTTYSPRLEGLEALERYEMESQIKARFKVEGIECALINEGSEWSLRLRTPDSRRFGFYGAFLGIYDGMLMDGGAVGEKPEILTPSEQRQIQKKLDALNIP